MKKILFTLLVVFAGFATQAQETKDGLVWHTDLNKAVEIARQEQKPLLLFFTGSDWCGWCIKLQSEVFRKPEFLPWATEKAVLVELDFPRRTPQSDAIKMQNNQMQQMFAVQGYPTVWFVKPTIKEDGKTNFEQLGKTGYVAGGPAAWIAGADQILLNFKPDPKPIAAKKSKTKKTTKKNT